MNFRSTGVLFLALSLGSASGLAQTPPHHSTKHRAPTEETRPPQFSRPVIFMFNWSEGRWVVGEKVPLQFVSAILFTTEPCPLDFVGAKTMHRAWHFRDVGCWAPTANDGYDFASSITGYIENIPGPLGFMVQGEVQPDSSVLITEPDFDSTTFTQLAAQRLGQRQAQRLRQMQESQP